ncbi:ATPase domain of HSP90 chaperone/DNA topoisomerase II/histidine kinase [Zopfia rhizophila CBS 207.26]|uniref:ATPase domain of HSP90 chaperone/DNA topoisomerase II/histidine kinase n=1 Tax=Zopfia rhizophila CBS 207.26 TaxID=1314779 RepID=A0A6A6E6Q2_9PEZI|nr:ATPase domain of HSP90 chaperone/DNA topoisomerase II/histidine kinase [Zopfia rhizophila CBS 207.26]
MPATGIQALPPSIVKRIGLSQVLVDASSVVKELIGNALNARATAVFVEISTNTIDVIQVRDNGHGIPSEDRALVCRWYCTSKIREFDYLKEAGGKWLGFRGEAMASIRA